MVFVSDMKVSVSAMCCRLKEDWGPIVTVNIIPEYKCAWRYLLDKDWWTAIRYIIQLGDEAK